MKMVASHPLEPRAAEYLKENGFELYIANSSEPKTYLEELQHADAFILRLGICDAEVIKQCPNLKVIGRTGVGYDNVDVACASERGIPVVITPGANQRSVAEHTVALMFAAAKDLLSADRELRKGNWEVRNAHRSFELEGKTVGILGMGAIGREVAKICQGIGMRTAGYDPFLTRKAMLSQNVEYYEDYRALLQISDFVTIHVPLTEETRDMISAAELSSMKPDSIIINCSRGGIINEQALKDALNHRIILGAGVDVYTEEPIRRENPLLSAENLVLTPHSAAQTRESFYRMSLFCAQGCAAVCKGEQWEKVADPSVYQHGQWIR